MYSTDDFCEIFGITRRTVYNWIKSKKIHAVKIGRSWYIPAEEVSRIRKEGTK